jgi:hypothetical protein
MSLANAHQADQAADQSAGHAPRASALFSPTRFVRLARQQWQEQRRAWAMFTLVLTVLLALMAGFALGSSQGLGLMTEPQAYVYVGGLLLSGYLFAHQLLGVWRSREASLMYLMRPASTFEKWLLSVLTLLVLYPLAYTAVFALVYSVFGEWGYSMAVAAAEEAARNARGSAVEWVGPEKFVTFLPLRPHPSVQSALSLTGQAAWGLVYAGLMAYAALGLVYFRRHAALRTLVVAIGLCILSGLLMAGLDESVNSRAVTGWVLSDEERAGLSTAALVYGAVLWVSVPLLLWAASYRALRERDLA